MMMLITPAPLLPLGRYVDHIYYQHTKRLSVVYIISFYTHTRLYYIAVKNVCRQSPSHCHAFTFAMTVLAGGTCPLKTLARGFPAAC